MGGRAGMDVTPGGKDESLVPAGKRLGAEVEVAERVQLLIATLTIVVYNYVAQVRQQLNAPLYPF